MKWGAIFGGWTLIGLFFAGGTIVSAISRRAPVVWDRGVYFEIVYWLVCGLFTPVIYWFVRRYPIQRQH